MKSPVIKYSICLVALISLCTVTSSQTTLNPLFNNSTVQVSELSADTIKSGFGPFVVNGSLFFTANNNLKGGKLNNKARKKIYQLYEVKINKEGNMSGPPQPVNEAVPRFNNGPVAWCEKTGELFVTQNYIDRSIKRKPFHDEILRLKIIIMKQAGDKWEQVSEFPFYSPEFSVGHPAITESGDTLVFSSDMPGGFGETDLYYSVRKNGKWNTPVNLGPDINTSGKEEFAFITAKIDNSNYLIFSSTGRNGLGGLDMYYTRFPYDGSGIGHFESPINTQYDDFSMTISGESEFGYLTSNRSGKEADNIYKLTFEKNKKAEVAVKETIVEEVPVKKEEVKETKTIVKDTLPATPVTKFIVGQKIVLHNLYYDVNKWEIMPESAKELDRLVEFMKLNSQYSVQLGSHTDSQGSVEYNLKLSRLRAKAAVDYIISSGVDKSKIVGIGYGKSQLIHKCSPNPCTPEEQRENRRTEILITVNAKVEPVKK